MGIILPLNKLAGQPNADVDCRFHGRLSPMLQLCACHTRVQAARIPSCVCCVARDCHGTKIYVHSDVC